MQIRCSARLRVSSPVLAIAVAFALAVVGGCGIKGPLKLPPPAPGSAPAPAPSGAAPSPTAMPAHSPEAMPAEPPATPAQPTDSRKP
jgi:diaminopimelate decarboxylase